MIVPFARILGAQAVPAALATLCLATGSAHAQQGFPEQARTTTSAQGEGIYQRKCAMCHDHAHDNIPLRIIIQRKTPEGIIAALTNGPMRRMAEGLSQADIKEVAIYVSGKPLGTDPSPTANMCPPGRATTTSDKTGWGYWGHDIRNTLFQPEPGLAAADLGRLKLKWAFAYPGGGAPAEPIAVGNRLFLTSSGGLFALDATTGCTLWHSAAGAGAKLVTTGALSRDPSRLLLFFGDGKANVSAVDAADGKVLWTVKVDDHASGRVTGPVTFFRDRLYIPVSSMEDPLSHDPAYPCCTFRGSVASVDAATGKLNWKSHTISQAPAPLHKKNEAGTELFGPAGGAIYAPLTIDEKRKVIYAATAESYHADQTDGSNAIIAFDLDTGARKWVQQPRPKDNATHCANQDEEDACENPASPLFEFAAPTVLAALAGGGDVVLAGQKSGVVYALDPDHGGKLLWETRVGQGGSMGGVELGFTVNGGVAYVPVSDSEVKPPYAPGGIAAIDIATGKTLWQAKAANPAVCNWGSYGCNAAQAGAAASIPGAVFSGSWDGHMRAYANADGRVLWEVDTGHAFDAVNGVKATGGAISGYSVIVSGGSVFVVSGASSMTHPGNALLAFTVDGK